MHLVQVVMDTGQVAAAPGALLQRLVPGELVGEHLVGEAAVLLQAAERLVVPLPGLCRGGGGGGGAGGPGGRGAGSGGLIKCRC